MKRQKDRECFKPPRLTNLYQSDGGSKPLSKCLIDYLNTLRNRQVVQPRWKPSNPKRYSCIHSVPSKSVINTCGRQRRFHFWVRRIVRSSKRSRFKDNEVILEGLETGVEEKERADTEICQGRKMWMLGSMKLLNE